jgi:hypothetical protein
MMAMIMMILEWEPEGTRRKGRHRERWVDGWIEGWSKTEYYWPWTEIRGCYI